MIGDDLVRVVFQSIDQEKVVLIAELELIHGTLLVPVAPKGPRSVKAVSAAAHESRKVIECLRQGVPPPNGLEAWTIGLDDVRQRLGAALADASGRRQGSSIVVEGPFGCGKSHVGRWARELALKRGLAVMQVDLDGAALSFSNPAVLTARLLASLELPDGRGGILQPPGLGTLLREAGSRLGGVAVKGIEEFAFFLKRWDAFDGNEEAIEVLESFLAGELAASTAQARLRTSLGEPALVVPALRMNYGSRRDRVGARVDQMLRLYQLAERCGTKGVLVIVDELDHDHGGGRWKTDSVQPGIDTFRSLGEKGPFVTLFLATPGIAELKGPRFRDVQLPVLNEQHLRIVFAKTIEAYVAAEPSVPRPGNLEPLFGQAWLLYVKQYKQKGWGPRFFVRVAVEACDLARSRGISVGDLQF
jgi:hypothetical protein